MMDGEVITFRGDRTTGETCDDPKPVQIEWVQATMAGGED